MALDTHPVVVFFAVILKLYILTELAGTVTLIGLDPKVALVTTLKPVIAVGATVAIEY